MVNFACFVLEWEKVNGMTRRTDDIQRQESSAKLYAKNSEICSELFPFCV
jgi:hypothetical protein